MAEKTASKIPDKPPDPAEDTFLGAFSDTPKVGFTLASDVIDWKDYSNEKPTEPTPPKPLDIPDQKTFEQGVFKQLGVNPFKLNVMDAIIKSDKQLPELFREFFKGKVSWYDREKLSKKQLDAWQDLVKRYHAFIEAKAVTYKSQKIDEYKWLMGNYEADVAKKKTVYDKKWQRYQSDLGLWEKKGGAGKAAPTTKPVFDTTDKKVVFKTESDIAREPDRFIPPPKEPKAGTDKETIIKNYIGSFKTPPGVMGEIKTRKPAERRTRLKGLFRAMNIERKRKTLDENDIARIEETVMTDLGISTELQHGIRAAKMAGATADQLIAEIERYTKEEEKKGKK